MTVLSILLLSTGLAAGQVESPFGPTQAADTQSGGVSETSEDGLPLEVGAYLFGRYEMRDRYDRIGVSRGRFAEGNYTAYRARLSLTSALIDLGTGLRVQFRFAPQAAGFFGTLPSTVSTAEFGLYEGWLHLEGSGWSVEAGRLRLNYGEALVIGDLDWNQVGRSFDGLRGHFEIGGDSWIDVIFTQLGEGLGGPDESAFADDLFFAGVYASLGGLVNESTVLEPYVLSQLWGERDPPGVAVPGAAQLTAGVRFKSDVGPVDVRFEPGVQFGQRRVGVAVSDVQAFQADLEVGMQVQEGIRVSLEGAYATGDDPGTAKIEGWDELYPTTHKWLGLMDVIGIRTNVASMVLHTAFVSGPFKALIDGHLFWRPETFDGQSSYAGAEINAQGIYTLGRGMTLRGLYGMFIPGSDHFFAAGTFNDDVVHYVEAQWTYRL